LEELEDVVKLYFDYLKEIPNSSEENDDKISELKAFMKYDLKKLQENQFAKYQDLFPLNFAADLYLLISQKIQN
jgi:hypothetical protein